MVGTSDEGGVDVADGSDVATLTAVNREELAAVRLGEPEQFSFTGAHGDTVYAWVVDEAHNRYGSRGQRTPADRIDDLAPLDSSERPVDFMNGWGQHKRVFVNEVRVIDYTQEADQEHQGVVKVTLIEFADRPVGTWGDFETLTWTEAETYTYNQIENLIP